MGRRLSDCLALVHQGRWKALGRERCCSGQLGTFRWEELQKHRKGRARKELVAELQTGRFLKEVGGLHELRSKHKIRCQKWWLRTRLSWKLRWNCLEGVQAGKPWSHWLEESPEGLAFYWKSSLLKQDFCLLVKGILRDLEGSGVFVMFAKETVVFQNQEFCCKIFKESIVCSRYSVYIAGKFSVFMEVLTPSLSSHKDLFLHSVQINSEPRFFQNFFWRFHFNAWSLTSLLVGGC